MTAEMGVWQKPELTVLTRTQPEESVLAACKDSGGLGAGTKNQACHTKGGPTCMPCNTAANS
jgi:hypothetical protein